MYNKHFTHKINASKPLSTVCALGLRAFFMPAIYCCHSINYGQPAMKTKIKLKHKKSVLKYRVKDQLDSLQESFPEQNHYQIKIFAIKMMLENGQIKLLDTLLNQKI